MCECERRKFNRLLKPLLAAGDDLAKAIEKANWGTIAHPTMHMKDAIAVWREIADEYETEKVG